LKSTAVTREFGDAQALGYTRVFAHLREQLLSGSVRPGDRLASERELALALGVSRPVLREALRALAMIGAVEILHGVGTIVRRPDVSVLGEFFTFVLAQQSELVDDVVQARIAIECQAIRLACSRATLADMEALRRALDRIHATIEDPDAGAEADFAFHAALVRASHSETLICLYQAMEELLRRSHRDRRELVRRSPDIKRYLAQDHARIFDAIAAGVPQDADDVLRRHFAIGDEYRRQAVLDTTALQPATGRSNV
jgi:GntR family transcriptional regulator, transcriptional repressor for pyruvate dehydrogenase complex